MVTTQIPMDPGHRRPKRPVTTDATAPGAAPQSPRTARVLLGAAAVLSPLLGTAFVATDPGTLPREPAAEFLPPIAERTTMHVVSTTFQLGAMISGVALAVLVALALGRRYPRMAGTAAVLLAVGHCGAVAFAAAKLVAVGLTADGQVRPGAEEIWDAVRTGPFFDVMGYPLIMVVPGMLLLSVLLFRARAAVGWWPGLLVLVGFVAGSGEFPLAVTVAGWAVLVPAVAALARAYVAAADAAVLPSNVVVPDRGAHAR